MRCKSFIERIKRTGRRDSLNVVPSRKLSESVEGKMAVLIAENGRPTGCTLNEPLENTLNNGHQRSIRGRVMVSYLWEPFDRYA